MSITDQRPGSGLDDFEKSVSFRKQQDSNKRSISMRRVLAVAALVAFLPTAHAQDKGKSDFTHNAEIRIRDTFEQNESGNSNVQPSHHNTIAQRFKLGLGFKASEKLFANATLLQAANWGQSSGEPIGDRGTVTGGPTNNGDEPNFMSVNEAYAGWMMSDDFTAKFGRMNFAFGDGSVMSVNDWQPQPYSFDGVTLKYEAAFGRFTGFAFKYRDLTGSTTATSDPQHDAYGLVFDLKNMPEVLKMANAYVIQDVADGVYGGGTTATVAGLQNMNALRWGLLAGLSFGAFDVKAAYNQVGGKNTAIAAGGATTEKTINQNMMAAQVAFNMPNLMASKFWINYHRDSGTSRSDAATHDNTYDPYFYDKHDGSGPMEIVAWGNLTDISAGWNLKPMDTTDVGISYHMFSRTNTDSGIMYGTFGGNLAQPNTTDSATGSEIDVWGEHSYGSGLSTLARVGYFMPGAALKNSAAPGSRSMSDSIMQVQVQGKMTF
jgi:prepilin-type processing-associated H-X9-DG protein